MSPKKLAGIKDPEMLGSMAAMRRAAETARRVAVQTDTAIVVVRGGKLIRITAEQLRAGSR